MVCQCVSVSTKGTVRRKTVSGADPGFPIRAGRQASEGPPTGDFAKFSKKLH